MHHVNKQLALFFDQVGTRNYQKKLIASLITLFYVIVFHGNLILLLGFNIEIPEIYYCLSQWSPLIMYQIVYLSVIVVFFYLADFNFKVRTKIVRPVEDYEDFR